MSHDPQYRPRVSHVGCFVSSSPPNDSASSLRLLTPSPYPRNRYQGCWAATFGVNEPSTLAYAHPSPQEPSRIPPHGHRLLSSRAVPTSVQTYRAEARTAYVEDSFGSGLFADMYARLRSPRCASWIRLSSSTLTVITMGSMEHRWIRGGKRYVEETLTKKASCLRTP